MCASSFSFLYSSRSMHRINQERCSSATHLLHNIFKEEVIMEGTEISGFGETVAMFRTRAGLSQQKVASALGMSRRAIAAWEAGDNLPKAKGIVLQLARLFNLNDEEVTMLLKAAGIDPSLAIWNVPF